MKKLVLFLIVVGVAFWAGQNKEQASGYLKTFENKLEGIFAKRAEAPGEGESDAAAGSPEMASVTPPAEAVVPPPAEPAPVELPEGYYYTRERLSEVTDQGVRSIPARTKVKKVGETARKVTVDSGSVIVNTDLWKLTRDPKEVAKLAQP